MFVYDGWIYVGNVVGEFKNFKCDLFLVILVGIGCIMVVYLLINVIFLLILLIELFVGNLNVVLDILKILFGENGGKIIIIGILIFVYGMINGYIMIGMCVLYVMVERKLLLFSYLFVKLIKFGVLWFGVII